jgi:hypothetical protein
MTGAFVLSLTMSGAALVALAVLGVLAFRYAGSAGQAGLLWRGVLVVVGGILAWILVGRLPAWEPPTGRATLEARAAELTARAIAPGSALACLDAVANTVVEDGCEKALFATPEAVAAAVDYVDARFSLLAPSLALADRDPSYRPMLERLRRALETDRFGLVAHVLTTRGCTVSECPDLDLLRDSTAVVANMKSRAFDMRVGAHALAWMPGATRGAVAAAPTPDGSTLAPTTGTAPAHAAGTEAGGGTPGRFDFPSADSIPPVSIMAPEAAPTERAAEPKPAQPAKRPAAQRQNGRDSASPAPQAQRAAPPLPIAPPAPAPAAR